MLTLSGVRGCSLVNYRPRIFIPPREYIISFTACYPNFSPLFPSFKVFNRITFLLHYSWILNMDHPASIIHTHWYLQLRRDFDKYTAEILIYICFAKIATPTLFCFLTDKPRMIDNP